MVSLKDIKEKLKSIGNRKIRVGWFKESTYDGKTPVAQVAVWNEYGVPNIPVTDKMRGFLGANGLHLKKSTTHLHIPARPFMRTCCDDNRGKWKEEMQNGVQAVLAGNVTAEQMTEMIGGMVAGDLQESISKVRTPPLSTATVMFRQNRKGGASSDQPLNDTGLMIASVTYKVNDEST